MRRTLPGTLSVLLAGTALAVAACGGPAGDTGDAGGSGDPGGSSGSSGAGQMTGSPSAAESNPPSPPLPSPDPSSAPASAAPTSLTVQFSADGQTPSGTWTLQCDGGTPVGGSGAPDPAAACAALAASGAALFAAPAANLMCTQNFAGPQRASVRGTVDGQPVDATFSLSDGCQISRWEQLAGLLGPADGSL